MENLAIFMSQFGNEADVNGDVVPTDVWQKAFENYIQSDGRVYLRWPGVEDRLIGHVSGTEPIDRVILNGDSKEKQTGFLVEIIPDGEAGPFAVSMMRHPPSFSIAVRGPEPSIVIDCDTKSKAVKS